MNFFNPEVVFKGKIKCDQAPAESTDLVRKTDVSGLSYISAIDPASQNMLSVDGSGRLKLENLAITDVHVDDTQTSLANFISNESSIAADLKEGDVLILTAPSAGTEVYMVSGVNGSVAGNYTEIESTLTAAEVGAILQAGDGISINSATAQISANIAAGTGLSSSTSNGQITLSLDATTSNVSEGTNLYYTNARSRSAISVASVSSPDVQLLTYNSGTGAFSVPASSVFAQFVAGTGLSYSNGEYSFTGNSDIVSEGSSNLYFTNARARSALVAGTGITYASGSGTISMNLVGGTAIGISGNTISFNGSSSDVSEGTNLYYTNARARASVSADSAAGNLLTYDSATGAFLVSTSSVRGALSAGAGLSYSGGQFSFSGNSDIVSEGSSNLYFTNARSRSAISVASVSSPDVQLLTYNSGTGSFSVPASSVFAQFVAGTGLSYSNGEYSLNATTSNVPEGTNQYHTSARVRAAISAGSQADEMISYNSGNGSFSLRENQLRYETQVTLSANVAATITHNLGKKLVHCTAMDSAGNMIQLETVFTSTTQLTVKSNAGVTVDLAISI